jgi:ferredoxin
MEFIEALPEVRDGAAVPFATWGAVTSGIALWQMGRSLQKKGFVLAGGAAVVTEHCMMWRSRTASGAGRPESEDFQKIEGFTRKLFDRLRSGAPAPVDLAVLDYQRAHHAKEMKEKIDQPWMIVPKSVDKKKCTACGICVEECPVNAVSLAPLPVFEKTCFDCFNCVRLCPEEAIDTPLTAETIEAHIAQLKEKYRETPETKVFLSQ